MIFEREKIVLKGRNHEFCRVILHAEATMDWCVSVWAREFALALVFVEKNKKSGAGELAACVGLCHVYGTCHVIT